LSSFDTLGGIGLGKRSPVSMVERRALSSFDTLGGDRKE
uniref:Transcriptional regulator n=1 Tax=Angiostrongylus cantonensis TaxID=6313 RepID=A0A0K0DRU0_ANGCA